MGTRETVGQHRGEATRSLIHVGHNAWRLEEAERLAFLIDGEAYYGALARALERARHSVLIAGWEIDDKTSLDPLGQRRGRPTHLVEVLRARLEACPGLQVHVLAWDFAMIYAMERGLLPLFRLRLTTGPRLHLHADSHHPLGASHHQKLVVIDDRVAFLGGLDITQRRWDRPAHLPHQEGRVDEEGKPYPPFHDVQVAVQGEAAAAVGDLFRRRWLTATGRSLSPSPAVGGDPPWPDGLAPDAERVEVVLARTRAAYDGQEEVREVERLYLDIIASARRSIYIENQYLTSASVVAALAERLREDDGPEVVLVLPRRCLGWLEQRTVGLLRRRRLHELREADHAGRLRVLYPRVRGVDQGVFVHAKVMVVDDSAARVGSANLSNRSMGFDTELDLALVSGGDERVARTVSGFRDRLLAEHLGTDAATVAARIDASEGSLLAAVDSLAGESERTLRPVEELPLEPGWEEALELGQDLADPESPEEPERLVSSFLGHDIPEAARSPWVKAAVAAAVIAVLAGAWRFTPLGDLLSADRIARALDALESAPLAPVTVAALYVAASVLFFPVTVLILATALAFPPLEAVAYGFAGVLCASAATFGLGRLLGRDLVRRVAGRRLNAVSRRVARRGVLAVAAVRLVPVAPFTLVNLVAGATHVGFRDFLLGTFIGVAPGVIGVVALEAGLEDLVRRPGWSGALFVVAVLAALVALVAVVRRVAARSGA